MGTDLAMNLIALRTAVNDQAVAIAVMRADHEMQQELLRALDPTRAPPPPGQGRVIDKTV